MKNKLKEFLTADEAGNVLRQPNRSTLEGKRDFCILSLMIRTGIRRAELCNLKRKNIRTEGKKASLNVRGKGEKSRLIPLTDPELLDMLSKYFKKAGNLELPDAPMFFKIRTRPGEKPQAITWATIRYLVPKYTAMAGIKKRITPHSLRHTFLTLTLQAGADLATVRDLAGHSSTNVTSNYLHTTEERKEEAVARLAL